MRREGDGAGKARSREGTGQGQRAVDTGDGDKGRVVCVSVQSFGCPNTTFIATFSPVNQVAHSWQPAPANPDYADKTIGHPSASTETRSPVPKEKRKKSFTRLVPS